MYVLVQLRLFRSLCCESGGTLGGPHDFAECGLFLVFAHKLEVKGAEADVYLYEAKMEELSSTGKGTNRYGTGNRRADFFQLAVRNLNTLAVFKIRIRAQLTNL